nr:MAG TPA: hypothetical protein [Caudoviricetes sp.]
MAVANTSPPYRYTISPLSTFTPFLTSIVTLEVGFQVFFSLTLILLSVCPLDILCICSSLFAAVSPKLRGISESADKGRYALVNKSEALYFSPMISLVDK